MRPHAFFCCLVAGLLVPSAAAVDAAAPDQLSAEVPGFDLTVPPIRVVILTVEGSNQDDGLYRIEAHAFNGDPVDPFSQTRVPSPIGAVTPAAAVEIPYHSILPEFEVRLVDVEQVVITQPDRTITVEVEYRSSHGDTCAVDVLEEGCAATVPWRDDEWQDKGYATKNAALVTVTIEDERAGQEHSFMVPLAGLAGEAV